MDGFLFLVFISSFCVFIVATVMCFFSTLESLNHDFQVSRPLVLWFLYRSVDPPPYNRAIQ